MNRWIISPNIVEIHSNYLPKKGFAICKYNREYNKSLFEYSKTKSEYVYKCKKNEIKIPKKNDGHYQYYFLNNDVIYYERKLGPMTLKFSYDLISKTFNFDKINTIIPFEIGQIWPIGLHLSNIISVDLLMNRNLLLIHGAALEYNDRTICILSPSRTGKTSLINSLIKKGAKYISEDIILTDGKKVYLIPPNNNSFFHNTKNLIDISKMDSKIDELVFVTINKGGELYDKKILLSLLNLYSNRIPYEMDKFIQSIFYFQSVNYKKLEMKRSRIIKKILKNKISITHDLGCIKWLK